MKRVQRSLPRLLTMATVLVLATVLYAVATPGEVSASDPTSSMSVSVYPTIECISVVSDYEGDSNRNSEAILEYKKSGSGAWLPGLPMSRIYGQSAWGGSIIGLSANTQYEIRVTYVDPDGVNSANPVGDSVTTRGDTAPSGNGESYFVATTGSDAMGDGSIGNPWGSIQYAAAQVSPGDTVYLMPGKYYEHVQIDTSGSPGSYISFVSYDMDNKAVLEGADATIERNASGDIWTHSGDSIWHTTYTFAPACVVQDDTRLYSYNSATDWATRFSGIDGGYYWDSGSNRLYVELPDGSDPNDHTMYVDAHSGGGWWEDSALRLLRADYVRVQGLEIGHYSCGILNQYSSHCVFEDNAIHHVRFGIQLSRDVSARSTDVLIQDNEFFDTSIRDWPWNLVKGTAIEGAAVHFWHSGQGSVIRRNTIHGLHNGVAACDIYEAQKYCRDIDVCDNTLYDLGDDAIAIDCTGTNMRVWGNTIMNARSGISAVPLARGPAYIFRNVIVDCEHQAFKIGSVVMDSMGFVHFYHNTSWISGYQSGEAKDGFAQSDPGLGNLISRNNIVHSGRLAIYVEDDNNLDFDSDCLYAEIGSRLVKWLGTDYANIAAFYGATSQEEHGIREADSRFVDPVNGDFGLSSDSPCIDAGATIPGINDATSQWPYRGSAPDIGAYEFSLAEQVAVTMSTPSEAAEGSELIARVEVSQVTSFDSANYDVKYDPAVLEITDINSGTIAGSTIPVDMWSLIGPGTARVVQNVPGLSGVSGSGHLAEVHFSVVGSEGDTSEAGFANGVLSNNAASEMPATWTGGSVTITAPLVANFAASQLEGVAGATEFAFIDQTAGGTAPYTYEWDFGDGTTSTSANPTHTYAAPGTYSVTLTVTDVLSAQSVETKVGYLSVLDPIATEFSINPLQGVAGLTTFTFTDQTTGGKPGYTYEWDFGDGTTSTSANPTHTYAAPGTYSVTLTVTDSLSAMDSETKADCVIVYKPGDANQDGDVDNLDITKIERIIIMLDGSTPGADANNDGVINCLDVTRVEQIIMGL